MVIAKDFVYNNLMPQKNYDEPKISEVVSVVAHQLKNPISIVKWYLESLLLEDCGKINKKQKEYLTDAMENTIRMSTTVNHLLDVSCIEEGRYKLQSEKFSLEEIIKNVIQNFASWARASNAEISFNSEERLPQVISDSLKIRQVVENIISNALKYKHPSRGRVEINLKREGDYILFSCKDNGIGIAEEDTGRIFTKFYRSEKALELDPSGTGLGLYINKAIVELSGGKIWVTRNPTGGVTFYFTLPIAP